MVTQDVIIVGTHGRVIEVDTKIDLTPFASGSGSVELVVRKPDLTETAWEATFKDSDPTLGILVHELAAGEIDMPGDFMVHSHVVNPDTVPPVDDLGIQPYRIKAVSKFHRER